MKPSLGVCYYPEQWSEDLWESDAARMAEIGLTYVRIGEFAWSRIEPKSGDIQLDWMLRSMDILHRNGLKVVLGTPTATPPRWLVSKMPDMRIVDEKGRVQKFGSRRHYCFSHQGYRGEADRIVSIIAEAVKDHPALALWQTDNEYGCHYSTLSYSDAALTGFRKWLREKYHDIGKLNVAWGTVFWSMEYADFDEIELPNLTQCEAAPTHWMDFRRYSSDQVIAFNKVQVDALRRITPDMPITHNYMGAHSSFDHFKIGADMDVASWDSYPIGRIEVQEGLSDRKARYARQGDPDMQAFHNDLYRSVGKGRAWIMEQQPGPVNWADYNADPLPGMARMWAWEAFAHGVEAVCYFRWRQAPYAQEQMHSGLLRPDDKPAPAFDEAAQVASEIPEHLPELHQGQADCAIIFDYESEWAWGIQPQSKGFSHFDIVYAQYRQLRKLGLNVDILSSRTRDLSAYNLVFVPAVFALNEDLVQAISETSAQVVIGPRSGSKTVDFQIPDDLGPALSANLLDVKVVRVASLSPNTPVCIQGGGKAVQWLDKIETSAEVSMATHDGWAILASQGNVHYLTAVLDDEAHARLTADMVQKAELSDQTIVMPSGLRARHVGDRVFFFNYAPEVHDLNKLGLAGEFSLDGPNLQPGGVAILRVS